MNVETKARVTLFLIFEFLLEPQGPVMGKKKLEGNSLLDYRPPDAGLRMQLLWGASNFRGTFTTHSSWYRSRATNCGDQVPIEHVLCARERWPKQPRWHLPIFTPRTATRRQPCAVSPIPPPFSARTTFKKNAVQQLLQLHLDENRKLLIQPPQSQS
jgi:hypothetical protein